MILRLHRSRAGREELVDLPFHFGIAPRAIEIDQYLGMSEVIELHALFKRWTNGRGLNSQKITESFSIPLNVVYVFHKTAGAIHHYRFDRIE